MPLSKTRTTMSNKARLEHKLYLARENPEPVFDISECSLKQVPSGTYTLCKVFRKRTLLLNNNKLSSLAGGGALSDLSLLTILDLSSNELNSLPSDVRNLVSLEKLFLQDNNLKRLPNEIVNLGNLNVLNVSKNNLKELPELLGELRKLTILNISFNKAIKCLPKSLGYAQKIIQLEIDGLNHLSYPPKDILDGGAIVIIAFLSIECGIEYNPEETFVETEQIKNVNSEQVKTFYQNKDNDTQEQRQSALLEVERNMKEQKELELGLQSMLKNNKKKLLEDLVLQQSQLEQEIVKVQQERDVNKAKLLSHIYDAEKEADAVIKQFLKTSEEERLTQATLTEQEKREEMQLLNASCSQHLLRTKDTLMSMEELLKEELLRENRLAEYAKFRDYNARSLLSIEVKNNDNLMQIMKNQERNRQDLVERLRKDEALQKAAVAALLELSDARSWSIVQQVNLVQSQLATLTNIELERRKLEMNQQLNDIADKRVTLSAILLDLLEQQEKRREELLDTIKHIEEYRDTSPTRRSSLFWLMQYQSLMDARPQGLLETLEPTLVRHVAIAGVLHCLPFLTTLPSMLPDIDDEQLKAIGINSDVDRAAIKLAAENYLSEKKLNSHEPIIIPSAPIDDHPSAPPEEAPCTSTSIQENTQRMNTTECVVCMDSQCDIIFFPCGHLCCCAICTEMITSECPMCRSEITRKIRVIQP
ncbi:E3 ubiquitin-protein ligase LRSAM1-like isoform X2 [Leptopilina heterotoma]|uniref:E3 ubiquitin-protein ligase LRSAM1-like isoform X2 n=1 Tax=Leptopilina heterotoma TaxID=63436 RepID=UPI001CA98A4D|nr:E3 ubiquitin-protein ligase LRSAM1-like isoform X2 [Leptopilina heterotoma]